MTMLSDVLKKMCQSLFTTDILIFLAFIAELSVLLIAIKCAEKSTVNIEKKNSNKENSKKKASNSDLIITYNLFTTGISIFPLLGMLGTVAGLLGLDLSAGDMENIKNNFFMALTSTAWGIVFSIGFKIVHAVTEHYFEKKIQESTELVDECNQLFEKENGC